MTGGKSQEGARYVACNKILDRRGKSQEGARYGACNEDPKFDVLQLHLVDDA